MAYNDKHKQLIQYFMYERAVSEDEAKNVNNKLFPGKNIDDTIEIINSKIDPLEIKINKVICDQNGNISYVLIATFLDEFNTKPDPKKLIFREIVDLIMTSGGSIPYDNLIMFNSKVDDKILEDYFTHKYLVADQNENIFLSPLAISELEGYLVEKFKEKRCVCCMNFVGNGIECPFCKKLVHGHCVTAYFSSVGNKKCPKCSNLLNIEWLPIDINNKLN